MCEGPVDGSEVGVDFRRVEEYSEENLDTSHFRSSAPNTL